MKGAKGIDFVFSLPWVSQYALIAGKTPVAPSGSMALAMGAALACPDRRLLCVLADGSGMYTAEALWTMAREHLNVTTIIFANRAYAALKRKFSSLGWGPGPSATDLFEHWPGPRLGISGKRNGVPGTSVTTLDTFVMAL